MRSTKDLRLIVGTIVRVPNDIEEDETIGGNFRDFRLGTLLSLNQELSSAQVQLVHLELGTQYIENRELPIEYLNRCELPEDIPFIHCQSKEKGTILCIHKMQDGFQFYFVRFQNRVESISEEFIFFNSHYQAPNPVDQIKRYELHNPVWRDKRNLIIECYRELQNSTFGIEDLVGTRVHLLNHQAEVIAEVLSHSSCRFGLADEVGLGKTIEACVILKSLRKREGIKALIIAPHNLIHQWQNELNDKFWLKFNVIESDQVQLPIHPEDTIISTEALEKYPKLQLWAQMKEWGLLIIDEVHKTYSKPRLFEHLLNLSTLSRHVLLLSATPIQGETAEYIFLLTLLDPAQYSQLNTDIFQKMLSAQHKIREAVAYLVKDLTPEHFDAKEFLEEIDFVLDKLDHDKELARMTARVQSNEDLDKAKDVIAYICTNYRLENRIIRNRRKTLRDRKQITLPCRDFTMQYAYTPSDVERRIYDNLHTYVDICLENPSYKSMLQYLFHAASSSPYALIKLLKLRQGEKLTETLCAEQESVIEAFTVERLPEEIRLCNDLINLTEKWQEETTKHINSLPQYELPVNTNVRIAQVVRAIVDHMGTSEQKILVFSAWHPTLYIVEKLLKRRYGSNTVTRFQAGMTTEDLQKQADRFQSDPDCRILLLDESGGEGRNFQIAQIIIHLDLPWTPARIEQRIGRVDRLGRSGSILSILPFAFGSLEADLISIWQDAFQIFSLSMSGMEIVLESIQNQIFDAFVKDSRDGISSLREEMIRKAEELRKTVDDERYYEENAGNLEWSQQLQHILKRYSEEDILREPVLKWAELAGLYHHYNPETELAWIGKADFNLKSINNAKFINPPNMKEALDRSGRPNNQTLMGTFNRKIAVKREDIIFFAKGEPWTDGILQNAVLADRGRCCAIQRKVSGLDIDWFGFEFLFSCRVNPRPLYRRGLLPVHLFKAGEFFTLPATYSHLVSMDGQIMEFNSLEKNAIKRPFSKNVDTHLGKRGGFVCHIQELKLLFPPNIWEEAIQKSYAAALEYLHQQNDVLIKEDAELARETLDKRVRGQHAAIRWLPKEKQTHHKQQIKLMQQVSDSIVDGILQTEWILESVCFWALIPRI
jgi:ATP-dependent helicase HepA